MATFASLAGVKLPENDREGQPIMFDSYDMTPVLFGTGKSPRNTWFYFTENELTPGAARVGNYKAVFNLRGDDGDKTGGLAVDRNLGWKGPETYVATVPQVFDLWQDPQERYDIFMNNYTERTWELVTINAATQGLMQTYVQYPPRKMQSEAYTGPITLSDYERFQFVGDALAKEGFTFPCRLETEPGRSRSAPEALRGRLSCLPKRRSIQMTKRLIPDGSFSPPRCSQPLRSAAALGADPIRYRPGTMAR